MFPTSFGARQPTLPAARTMTLARIGTAEGVDKRYERSWLQGLKTVFAGSGAPKEIEGDTQRIVKRGDIIAMPIWIDKPVSSDEDLSDNGTLPLDTDSDDSSSPSLARKPPTALAYFQVTALSYEPLNPLEEDFRSSTSSKARAGELGCYVDVGQHGSTRMVLTGVERSRVARRRADLVWHNLGEWKSRVQT